MTIALRETMIARSPALYWWRDARMKKECFCPMTNSGRTPPSWQRMQNLTSASHPYQEFNVNG
jgi:hypothetical protein